MKENKERYETQDLYEAAVLYYTYQKRPVFKLVSGVMIFSYEQTPGLTETLNSYRCGELIVIASAFALCIKKIRAILFEAKNARQEARND